MPRDMRHGEHVRRVKARRALALARMELRGASDERVAAASPTSFAVKIQDPETRRLIDEALARRARGEW